MTTTQHTPTRSRHTWHLVRHYLEMVVAMVVGMMVLGPLEGLVWPGLDDKRGGGAGAGAAGGVAVAAHPTALGVEGSAPHSDQLPS